MKVFAKQLIAASTLALAGLAQAGTVTAHPGETVQGLTLVGGSAVLSFSSQLLSALNIGQVTVTEVSPAKVTETYEYDPVFEEDTRVGSSASAPLTFMTVDDVTGEVLSAGSAGGAVLTAPKLSGISTGGSVTVANLSVDLVAKRVYADITGNFSGVKGAAATTLTNFHLWDYATLTGPTNVQVGAGSYTDVISGLTITADGLSKFSSALFLLETGRNTLATVTDFGTITSTIVASGTLVMPTPEVPEPGTWAMMTLGVAGLALVARRRART